MNHIISFSGGKDSTAMALEMLERGENIHSIIAFDTGWEFPQMLEHWDKFEEYTGIELIRLKPNRSFNFWMFEKPVKGRKGANKGIVYRHGVGFPSSSRRWCTREKVVALERYFINIENVCVNIGYAADEAHRLDREQLKNKPYKTRYPLIEYGIDEARALEICKAHGFDWGGLYEHFHRVSCWCCPLKSMDELRQLWENFPELWAELQDMENRLEGNNPEFRGNYTVDYLTKRFAEEKRLGDKFNVRQYNKMIRTSDQMNLF